MAVVPAALTVHLGVEGQHRSSAEIDRERWKDRETTLAIVDPVVEPFAGSDRAIANAPVLGDRAGGIDARASESEASDAPAKLERGHGHGLLEHEIDQRSR